MTAATKRWNRERVNVARFAEASGERLQLELVAGESGLSQVILEPTINRPGLGLSGFFKYFANRRIQVIGLAEHTYLTSLSTAERAERLRGLFEQKVPCVLVTRGKRVFPALTRLAEEFGVPVFRTPLITKHVVNVATIIMENLQAPTAKVQGTMIEIMGVGVLIEGKSGIGKSDAALALIRKGYSLVSDDITVLRRDSGGSVIGAPVKITQYHMEIRGIGIIHVPSLFGVSAVREHKKLDLVVNLCRPGEEPPEDLSGTVHRRDVMGAEIPLVYVVVEPGRDLANVIEAAALRHKLHTLGHDAEKELDARLMAMLGDGRELSD